MPQLPEYASHAAQIIQVGSWINDQNWVPATSGNFSIRVDQAHCAITVSGRHKGTLTPQDIMLVTMAGQSLDDKKPSAETLLHTQLYNKNDGINAVLHTHSVDAVTLSRVIETDTLKLNGYELQKAFCGITSHETAIEVPIFENDQNIPGLVDTVAKRLRNAHRFYLIRGHGLYTWGQDMDECARHLEAAETLLSCELKRRTLSSK